MNLSSARIGGIAALAFVGLVGTVNIILGAAGQPLAGASRGEVAAFFADSSGAVSLATAIAPLAWMCMAIFAGGAAAALRRLAERAEGWPLIGVGAAFAQNATFAAVVATQLALASGELSADVAWGVWQLHNALFTLNVMSLSIIMLAFSVGGLRAGLIRRWHGRLGLGASGVMALGAVTTPFALDGGPLGMIGFAGFLLWLVWLTTYGITLVRTSSPDRAPQDRVAVAA